MAFLPLCSQRHLHRRVKIRALHGSSPVIERTVFADVGHTSGSGVVQGDCNDGHLPVGVGHDAGGQDNQWCLVPADGTTYTPPSLGGGGVYALCCCTDWLGG